MTPVPLLLVCDDAGFASVDRGIRALAERTGLPVCADYLIGVEGAARRAREMSAHPLVSVGLHCELEGVTDAERVAQSRALAATGETLGMRAEIRDKAAADARRQLALFRDALGRDPAHVSAHGDFNVGPDGRLLEWWLELMRELFAGSPPPLQHGVPHVRHNLYRWNESAAARPPRTPAEFAEELRRHHDASAVEFVTHPALPGPGDAPLGMLFTAEMRVRDLDSAVEILRSGAIAAEGFAIAPVGGSG